VVAIKSPCPAFYILFAIIKHYNSQLRTNNMTEENSKPKTTRNRRPKGQSMPVMKELLGLMDQRTTIMNQIRADRMEIAGKQMQIAQREASLLSLEREIQWRASIFGMTPKVASDEAPQIPSPGSPMAVAGVQFAPQQPFLAPPVPGVLFNEGPPAPTGARFNRVNAADDLAGIS
jgi:hypothetical protein